MSTHLSAIKIRERVARQTTSMLLDMHRQVCLQMFAQPSDQRRPYAIVAINIESELFKRGVDVPSRLSYRQR